MKASCSIFIPAYNAGKTLPSVLDRIDDDTWRCIHKIYVINDGSLDDTVSVVENLRNKFTKLQLISFMENQGYGRAASKGLQLCIESESDYIVCLHADGQYPPENIAQFIFCMDKYSIDILQGSRHKDNTALSGGMPVYKYIAGKCLVWLENRIFGLQMTDYHSGFMFYRRSALEKLPFEKLSTSFDFDLEMIALGRALNLHISELAIPARYAGEKSYLNPVTYGLRVLRVLVRYYTGYYRRILLETALAHD